MKGTLPNFTKIKLANTGLQSSKSTKSFRWQLVDTEISNKKREKRKCKSDCDKFHNDLSWDLNSMDFKLVPKSIGLILETEANKTKLTHEKKIKDLLLINGFESLNNKRGK